MDMELYSPFFEVLHDEQFPVGYLGEGAHYSVLRAVVFHDKAGEHLKEGQYHDFAIIWDVDHDDRAIEAIDKIYVKGLLPRFAFFGENRAHFTALTFDKPDEADSLAKSVKKICEDIEGDRWKSTLGTIKNPKDIIDDEPDKVLTYLENINNIWALGLKPVEFD